MDGQRKMDAADSFSYCDISSVFITKTIERIISPMAVQLCHLIISLECDGSKHSELSWDLGKIAEDLSRATEHFALTAISLSAQCEDKCLKDELDQAAKSVVIIGKNMLLTVQKLCIQPTIQKHQEEFIIAAQNILLGILKILQLEDDASVRKICQAADWVLDCLLFLQTADSMSHLLTSFKDFSEALLLLNHLTERRINDIKDSLHRERLSGTLQILKKCVPMLYTATQNNINHRQDDQMIASKQYVFDLASKTTCELRFLLSGKVQHDQVKKKSSFSQQMYDLSGLLTNVCPTKLLNSDLDFHIGAIVFHAMFVADCSRQNIRLRLVRHCHCILELRKRLFDQLTQLQEKPPLKKTSFDLEQVCSTMKEQLGCLNHTLVCAIFYLILDNFTNAKDPLKKLLKASLKAKRKPSCHLQNPFALKTHPLFQAFYCHAEQLLRVANLVSAQCSKDKSIEEIQNCIECFCKVRDEVISLFVDAGKTQCVNKTIRQAQFIYQRWAQVTENLLLSFDDMVTIHEFLALFAAEIEEKRNVCENLLGNHEIETFHHQAADLCGLSEHVVQVINRYVDQSKDPIFRNGLRVLVRQFESSVTETKTAVVKCAELISCGTALEVFLDKTKLLFETFCNVQQGVKGCKHPDLMSPLRTEIQSVHHKPIITDFCESTVPQKDTVKAHLDHNVDLLSYEGFLSKPLPLTASSSTEILSNMNNIEAEQRVDLHWLVKDLIMAVKKSEPKEIHTSCSALIHIANTYIETAKELFPPGEVPHSETVINYEDTEKLASRLLLFINNGAMNPSLSRDTLVQTAIFLSHHIEHLKMNLILLSDFWYSFSCQLFCPPSSGDSVNSQTFSRTMESIAAIVQLICEWNTEPECTVFSGKRETLNAIQTKLTKLQGISKHLMTKGCFSVMQDNKDILESNCILWSVTIQQLLKSIDELTGSDVLSYPESIHLENVKITESQSFVCLCETSLWLQEAAKISVVNSLGEGKRDKIILLMDEVTSATDTILKLSDTENMSSGPAIFLAADCVLLQRELIIKSKLLMYLLNSIHQGSQYLMHNVADLAISLTNTLVSDKIAVKGTLEKNACLLVDNLKFLKDMLNKTLSSGKHEELIFLAEHLYFLTGHILTRAKDLLENGTCWKTFMIEAMSLNWLSKANQLTLHLQLHTDLDDTTLALVKKCLKSCEPIQPETTDNPVLLEARGRKKSTCTIDINISDQNKVLEKENKAYTEQEQSFIKSNSPNVLHNQRTPCDIEESGDKVNYVHSLCPKQQSVRKELNMAEQKYQIESHEQTRRIISLNNTFSLEQETESNIQQQEMCYAKTLGVSNQDKVQAVNKASNMTTVEQEVKRSEKESANQRTQNSHKTEETNEPIVTVREELKKEIFKDQQLSSRKTHIMPSESEQNKTFEETQSEFCKDEQETVCWLTPEAVKLDKQQKDCKKPQATSLQEERKTPATIEQLKTIRMPHKCILEPTYKVAKSPLTEEMETWDDESNVVVQVTREMAAHLSFMTQYLNRKGPIKTTDQLIASAKCIATHGQTLVRYVRIMAKNCIDKRSSAEIVCGMEQIQTISRQLCIISSVKAATGWDDSTGEDALVKNAQNLIHSVLQTWKAAEAACLVNTGDSPHDEEEAEVAAFCAHLRKKLRDRRKEFTNSNM